MPDISDRKDGVARKLLLHLEIPLGNHAIPAEAWLDVFHLLRTVRIARIQLRGIGVGQRRQRGDSLIEIQRGVKAVARNAKTIREALLHIVAEIGIEQRCIEDRPSAAEDGFALRAAGREREAYAWSDVLVIRVRPGCVAIAVRRKDQRARPTILWIDCRG